MYYGDMQLFSLFSLSCIFILDDNGDNLYNNVVVIVVKVVVYFFWDDNGDNLYNHAVVPVVIVVVYFLGTTTGVLCIYEPLYKSKRPALVR